MSKLYIWCEIVCVECSRTTSGRHTSGALPRKDMKSEASSEGWLFKHNEAFCGADCLEQHEDRLK